MTISSCSSLNSTVENEEVKKLLFPYSYSKTLEIKDQIDLAGSSAWIHQGRRSFEFVKLAAKEDVTCYNIAVRIAEFSMAAGLFASTGWVIGGSASALFTLVTTRSLSLSKIAWMNGGSVGSKCGLMFSIGFVGADILLNISYGDRYKIWLEEKRAAEIFLRVEKLFDGDNDLAEFICPITLGLMICPVKAPDGRTYEFEAIKRHIEGVERSITIAYESGSSESYISSLELGLSPIRGTPFTVKDLIPVDDYFHNLTEMLKHKMQLKRYQEFHPDIAESVVILGEIGAKVVACDRERLMSQVENYGDYKGLSDAEINNLRDMVRYRYKTSNKTYLLYQIEKTNEYFRNRLTEEEKEKELERFVRLKK